MSLHHSYALTYTWKKHRGCDNNWKKSKGSVVLQIGLLIIVINLYVYSSTCINRQHKKILPCPTFPSIQSKIISWRNRQISWNKINFMFYLDCFLSFFLPFISASILKPCDSSMTIIFCILRWESAIYHRELSSYKQKIKLKYRKKKIPIWSKNIPLLSSFSLSCIQKGTHRW